MSEESVPDHARPDLTACVVGQVDCIAVGKFPRTGRRELVARSGWWGSTGAGIPADFATSQPEMTNDVGHVDGTAGSEGRVLAQPLQFG